jgi:hypothetical protein
MSMAFPIRFTYQEKKIDAQGLLMDTWPCQQCRICMVKDYRAQQADVYDFFKVDDKDKVFSWILYADQREKIAKAIAAALEKNFSISNILASNLTSKSSNNTLKLVIILLCTI